MAYDNAQLQSDLAAWMENNSVELTAAQQTIINMAMATISKDLRVKALNVYDTTKTFTNGTATLAIPNVATMLSMRGIWYNSSGSIYLPIRPKPLTYLLEYWPDDTVLGSASAPVKYYAELDATNWKFAPTPYANSALRIAYRAQLAKLVAGGDTNWVVTNHYDFALTAVLLEASRFVIDDRQTGLIAVNKSRYDELRDTLNEMEKRTERDESRRPQVDAVNAPNAPSDSEAA